MTGFRAIHWARWQIDFFADQSNSLELGKQACKCCSSNAKTWTFAWSRVPKVQSLWSWITNFHVSYVTVLCPESFVVVTAVQRVGDLQLKISRMSKFIWWNKRTILSLPSSENRVDAGSTFRVTSVLVSHLAYTSCRRVDNTSTILLGLKLNKTT